MGRPGKDRKLKKGTGRFPMPRSENGDIKCYVQLLLIHQSVNH